MVRFYLEFKIFDKKKLLYFFNWKTIEAFEIPVEIELDNSACFPSPCQNRGACVPLLDRGYFCACESKIRSLFF